MSTDSNNVIFFEQQPLPVINDVDVDTLMRLLQNLSDFSDDVKASVEGEDSREQVAQLFGYLHRNIKDLASAADSVGCQVAT